MTDTNLDRETGTDDQSIACPNGCGTTLKVTDVMPDGGTVYKTCPKCHGGPSTQKAEKAAAKTERERGTDTSKES